MNAVSRRRALAGFGMVGAGLMLSSTAYACTTYKGKLTASGNGVGNSAQTVTGKNSGMSWCALPTPTVKVATGAQSISLITAASTRSGSCPASQMIVGLNAYSVAVTAPGAGYMPQGGGNGATHNCHGTTGQVLLTNGSVSLAGVFSPSTVSYTQAGVGPQSICIYNTAVSLGGDAIAINMDSV